MLVGVKIGIGLTFTVWVHNAVHVVTERLVIVPTVGEEPPVEVTVMEFGPTAVTVQIPEPKLPDKTFVAVMIDPTVIPAVEHRPVMVVDQEPLPKWVGAVTEPEIARNKLVTVPASGGFPPAAE